MWDDFYIICFWKQISYIQIYQSQSHTKWAGRAFWDRRQTSLPRMVVFWFFFITYQKLVHMYIFTVFNFQVVLSESICNKMCGASLHSISFVYWQINVFVRTLKHELVFKFSMWHLIVIRTFEQRFNNVFLKMVRKFDRSNKCHQHYFLHSLRSLCDFNLGVKHSLMTILILAYHLDLCFWRHCWTFRCARWKVQPSHSPSINWVWGCWRAGYRYYFRLLIKVSNTIIFWHDKGHRSGFP